MPTNVIHRCSCGACTAVAEPLLFAGADAPAGVRCTCNGCGCTTETKLSPVEPEAAPVEAEDEAGDEELVEAEAGEDPEEREDEGAEPEEGDEADGAPLEALGSPIVLEEDMCPECFHRGARLEALDARSCRITCGACGGQQVEEFTDAELQAAREGLEAREAEDEAREAEGEREEGDGDE